MATNTVNRATPDPSSRPVHDTGNDGVVTVLWRAFTVATGAVASMVLRASRAGSVPLDGSCGSTWFVATRSPDPSNVTSATFAIAVPVASAARGRTT